MSLFIIIRRGLNSLYISINSLARAIYISISLFSYNLISNDLFTEQLWITEEELEKKPELVKTMSVSPPKNSGDIRLICIKSKKDQVDLQPCGGTHIKNTSEIGRIVIGKIEKKGKNNRRVNIHFD